MKNTQPKPKQIGTQYKVEAKSKSGRQSWQKNNLQKII